MFSHSPQHGWENWCITLFVQISENALNLWTGTLKCIAAIVSAGFRIWQHFLTWTWKITFVMPITIIIAVIEYHAIAQGQWPWQLQDPQCVRHPSSAGSPHYGSMTKQLKCHWENKLPAEISGTELLERAPKKFHCWQAMQTHDQNIKEQLDNSSGND